MVAIFYLLGILVHYIFQFNESPKETIRHIQKQHLQKSGCIAMNFLTFAALLGLKLLMNWWKSQNYWVFGLFPSSSIPETRKRDVSETGSLSVLMWPTLLGTLESANLNQFTIHVWFTTDI
jgi:hypothetical protein